MAPCLPNSGRKTAIPQLNQRVGKENSFSNLASPEQPRKSVKAYSIEGEKTRKAVSRRRGAKQGGLKPGGPVKGLSKQAMVVTMPETLTVHEIATKLAEQRGDAALLTKGGRLSGIITDKDIAFRCVAKGCDPGMTSASAIMTAEPRCIPPETQPMDALRMMTDNKFRHLPVVDSNTVVGILDITKLLFDAIKALEKASDSSQGLFDSLTRMENNLAASHGAVDGRQKAFLDQIRTDMVRPTLQGQVDKQQKIARVGPHMTVAEAANVMLGLKASGTLVMEHDRLVGILTTRDILFRVIAIGYPAHTTLVSQVMTPNVESAPVATTLLDALKKMDAGHFRHLPVVNEDDKVIGIVDVLSLVYEAMSVMDRACESEPLMQSFFAAIFNSRAAAERERSPSLDDDALSSLSTRSFENFDSFTPRGSAAGSVDNSIDGLSDVADDAFSQAGSALSRDDGSLSIKMRDLDGNVFRFSQGCLKLASLEEAVRQRIGLSEQAEMVLKYEDDDGDHVVLLTDSDVQDCSVIARKNSWRYINLRVTVPGADAHSPPTPVARRGGSCANMSFYETVVPPAFEPYLPAAVCIAALGALAAGLASLRRR